MTEELALTLIFRIEELISVVAHIQGYLIFIVTVILLYFTYKFFRIFF